MVTDRLKPFHWLSPATTTTKRKEGKKAAVESPAGRWERSIVEGPRLRNRLPEPWVRAHLLLTYSQDTPLSLFLFFAVRRGENLNKTGTNKKFRPIFALSWWWTHFNVLKPSSGASGDCTGMKAEKGLILEMKVIIRISAWKEIIWLDWSNFNWLQWLLAGKQSSPFCSPRVQEISANTTVGRRRARVLKA